MLRGCSAVQLGSQAQQRPLTPSHGGSGERKHWKQLAVAHRPAVIFQQIRAGPVLRGGSAVQLGSQAQRSALRASVE